MNHGRNSHERAAIGKLHKLMDPDRGTKRENETLANALVMHIVDAAVEEMGRRAEREIRQQAAMDELRKHPGKY